MRQLHGTELKKFNKSTTRHDLEIVLICENIQYARNVASFFRIADAFKVKKIILTGISMQPPFGKELQKVSRGKERTVQWEYVDSTGKVMQKLKKDGYEIIAVELTDESVNLSDYRAKGKKIALLLGNEAYGVINKTLEKVDKAVFIPMFGKGASLNVTTAGAIALYKVTN